MKITDISSLGYKMPLTKTGNKRRNMFEVRVIHITHLCMEMSLSKVNKINNMNAKLVLNARYTV